MATPKIDPYLAAANAAIANLIMARDSAGRKCKRLELACDLLGSVNAAAKRDAFQEAIDAIQAELDRAAKV